MFFLSLLCFRCTLSEVWVTEYTVYTKFGHMFFAVLRIRDVYPGSRIRIRILTFYPSRIPDQGVKKAPDPGSGSATLVFCSVQTVFFLCCC